MRPFTRHPAPDFLLENAARWNQQWTDLKANNSGATFQWYKYNGRPVNQLLLTELKEQTQHHCSYCDAFPLGHADNTIDHFKPKGVPEFYDQAYAWSNLYCACADCQRIKMEQFSEDLLRPDTADYSFAHYFVYDYARHEIAVNPAASSDDQRRAEVTRTIFQFNGRSRVISRRHAWERWNSMNEEERFLDDFNFRFLFD